MNHLRPDSGAGGNFVRSEGASRYRYALARCAKRRRPLTAKDDEQLKLAAELGALLPAASAPELQLRVPVGSRLRQKQPRRWPAA
jgi:hypothetical protein